MTLVQLEYLLAVYRYKSFSKAAEKSYVTQPTLSMQIQNLEQELGLILFDRSKKPIQATDQGLKIIEQAQKVLAEVNHVYDIKDSLNKEVGGEIRVGVIPTVSPYLLPLFASTFTKNYPKVKLKTEEMITEAIIQALLSDDIDIGIMATPLNESGVFEYPVYEEKMLVYAAPECELAKHDLIKVNDLDGNDLWLLNEGHCFRSQILNVCSSYKVNHEDSNFTFESGSIDTLIRMVDMQGGFTIIPELLLPYLSNRQKKNVRSFEEPVPSRQISIVSRRKHLKQRQIEALKDEIIKGVGSHFASQESNEILAVY